MGCVAYERWYTLTDVLLARRLQSNNSVPTIVPVARRKETHSSFDFIGWWRF